VVSRFSCAAVIFDLDGVLVHSADAIRRSWKRWAAEHHLALDLVERAAHGRRAVDTIRAVAPFLDAELAARDLDAVQARDLVDITAGQGAPELVGQLRPREWAVVTSGGSDLARARLRAAGFPPPPVFVTADDVAAGKPSPEGYLLAARLLGHPPAECMVVEDAGAGVRAAVAAGMRVVGLAGDSGGEDLADADTVVRSCADLRIGRTADGRPVVEVTGTAGRAFRAHR
jgi:mannitol-1-/sugar-/sorbitol-6-phosphatase